MRALVYGMVGTNRGGIETFLLKMNSYMSSKMIFDYVIEEKECLHNEAIKQRGGRIFYVTSRSKSALKNIKDNKALLRKMRKTHEVAYFNLSSLSWIEPIKEAIKLGYRVYVHSHNAEFIAANSDFLHKSVNAINKKRLSKWNVTRLTCSKPARDFMFGNNESVKMIYNAIQPKQFAFDLNIRNEIRKSLNISENDKLIGFVGRLNDQKNPLFLPEIMEYVINNKSSIKMVILGDGPMKKELIHKIKSKHLEDVIMVLGNVTNVNDYMRAMDIFVLPSFHEGLPYVVVEAQTSGLKCIVSDAVTDEVNITGNVSFVPLNRGARFWSDVIIKSLEKPVTDRKKMEKFMKETSFNIENEALRLERILSYGGKNENR